MLGKIGDKYQAYCTMYKTHAMATHHGGTGCHLDRDIDLHVEDSETTGPDNDNESTSGLDATVILGGPEEKVTLMTLYTATRPNCWHLCRK